MSRWWWVLAVTVTVSACGVSADDSPRPFDAEEALRIESELAPQIPEEPFAGAGDTVDVWFVEGDRLVSVTRTVDVVDPVELVETLVAGPRPAEEGLGLRSAVAPTTSVLGVSQENGVARVDLSRDFALLGGEEELLAVGQVVTTLVGLEGIEAVAFALEGEDIPVPDAEGVLRDRLAAGDVRSLVIQAGEG